MKFIIVHIFCAILLFVCTENAPTNTSQPTSLQDNDVTQDINIYISTILQHASNFNISDYNTTELFEKNSKDELLHNVTIIIEKLPSTQFRVKYEYASDVFEMIWENVAVSFEGCLQNSNDCFATEQFLLNSTFFAPKWSNNATTDHYINQQNIKLITKDHKYEPDKELQIKEKIKQHMKTTFELRTRTQNDDAFKTIFFKPFGFGVFPQHTQNHFYSIKEISILSNESFLRKVNIAGLWNIENFTIDVFNTSGDFLKMQMSPVHGTMVQTFSEKGSSRRELSFDAENVSVSTDYKSDKINFKFGRYSVTNTESNQTLSNNESEIIIRAIESDIAKSLELYSKCLRLLVEKKIPMLKTGTLKEQVLDHTEGTMSKEQTHLNTCKTLYLTKP